MQVGLLQNIQKGLKCVCYSVVNLVISFVVFFFSKETAKIYFQLGCDKKEKERKGLRLNVRCKETQRAAGQPEFQPEGREQVFTQM